MKHLYKLFAVALLLVIMAGCSDKVDNPPKVNPNPEEDPITLSEFIAYIENNDTKADLHNPFSETESHWITWGADDAIGIFSDLEKTEHIVEYQYDREGLLDNYFNGSIFEGDPIAGNTFYAVYPYSSIANNDHPSTAAQSETVVTITLDKVQHLRYSQWGYGPNTQTVLDLGNMPMIAMSDDNILHFKQVMGLLKLDLTGSETVRVIRIGNFMKEDSYGKSIAVPIAGKASLEIPSGRMSFSNNESIHEITLDCGTNGVELDETNPATFYIALPPGNYTSFDVEIKTSTGAIRKQGGNLKIGAGEVTPLADLNPAFEQQLAYQRESLGFLYRETNGDNWKNNTNWLSEAPISEWYGITCDEDGFVTEINLGDNALSGEIVSGLNDLSKLRRLDVSNKGTSEITISSLNVSYNHALEYLDCSNQSLLHLDLSNNPALEYLDCSDNQLQTISSGGPIGIGLDVTKCTVLTHLDCSGNYDLNQYSAPTPLDLSNNIALTYLDCSYTSYSTTLSNNSLDLSNNTALDTLICNGCGLSSLDITACENLRVLMCRTNIFDELDVSNNLALEILDCIASRLTSLDVTKNTSLTKLWCDNNALTSLDVTKNTVLRQLSCSGNNLTSLDISKNTRLYELVCMNNQIASISLRNIDFNQTNFNIGLDQSGDSWIIAYVTEEQMLSWDTFSFTTNGYNNRVTPYCLGYSTSIQPFENNPVQQW